MKSPRSGEVGVWALTTASYRSVTGRRPPVSVPTGRFLAARRSLAPTAQPASASALRPAAVVTLHERGDGRPGLRPLGLVAEDLCVGLSLIHISEPTRLGMISYAVFCLKK